MDRLTDFLPPSPRDVAQGYQPSLAPAGLFITGEDRLRVTSFNATAGVTLAIEGRALVAGHGLRAFAERHVPATDRTATSTSFSIGEGWLLDVQIRASAGAPRRGSCFVLVELVRGGEGGAAAPLGVLVQGYVTDTQRRGWPLSPLELSTEGPGVLRSVTGTDPAANVEITETVPTNARWLLHAIRFTLTTDATVANREVSLTFDDGALVFARVPSRVTHAASLAIAYSAYRDAALEAVAQDTERSIRLPWLMLQGGHRVSTVTTNRQAGDNFSAPQLLVEEWIED